MKHCEICGCELTEDSACEFGHLTLCLEHYDYIQNNPEAMMELM